jgi:hypothetical protein
VVVANTLIKVACKRLECTEADLARDHMKVEPQRLYQWKTYRRKMPTRHLYHLVTLAGAKLTQTVGQYQIEWASMKSQRTNGVSLMKHIGLHKGGR